MAPRLNSVLLLAALAIISAAIFDRPTRDKRPDGRIVVRYWEKWSGFEGTVICGLVEEFNRSQNRIFVEYLCISQMDRKLMLAMAGGMPPDIAGQWGNGVPAYAENGSLYPLDKLAAEYGIKREDYLPSIWNTLTYQGRLWALPTTPATLALHWNKKLFREAGLDPEQPPRTLAELEEFNQKLTRYDGQGRITMLGHLPEEPGWWQPAWGYWFGGRLVDEMGGITATNRGNLAALKWVQSYPERFGKEAIMSLRDFGGANLASPQNLFFQNRIAMVLQGAWMYGYIKQYAPKDFEWGVAPFPSEQAGEEPVTLVECDTMVIPRDAAHPREAFEFMAWLQRPENMEKLCLGHLKFSPLRQVSDSFYAQHPDPHIQVYAKLAASQQAMTFPRIANWPEYSRNMGSAYNQVALLLRSPEEALAEVQTRQNESSWRRRPPARRAAPSPALGIL